MEQRIAVGETHLIHIVKKSYRSGHEALYVATQLFGMLHFVRAHAQRLFIPKERRPVAILRGAGYEARAEAEKRCAGRQQRLAWK